MRKIILITFCFLSFSCNTNQKNPIKWTDKDKDEVFAECISFAMEIDKMNAEKANNYCYCALDILVERFENKKIAGEQIGKDPSQRLIWHENCK
tara:strand:- start:116 stop:397 length:282 start_codon:yes stop_codon:yes gene_type:complete